MKNVCGYGITFHNFDNSFLAQMEGGGFPMEYEQVEDEGTFSDECLNENPEPNEGRKILICSLIFT